MKASLRALVGHSIDYAGVFPPASLPLHEAVACWNAYRSHEHSFLLRRFVVAAGQVDAIPAGFAGDLSVVGNADHPRAAALETKRVLVSTKPTYCEVAPPILDEVKAAGSFAKLRTGGVERDAIPSVETVHRYLSECIVRQLGCKVTAGLHHALRSEQPLTYAVDAPRATMHGFVNVLLAAVFLFAGNSCAAAGVLAEVDPATFAFTDEHAHWEDHFVPTALILAARADFLHSFGSCSFTEPVQDLARLGWL